VAPPSSLTHSSTLYGLPAAALAPIVPKTTPSVEFTCRPGGKPNAP
jgi:hypothetical protein